MKRVFSAFFAAVLAFSALPAAAMAETLNGKTYNVTLTENERMVDDFGTNEVTEQIKGLQPGDDFIFTIDIKHDHKTAADWYISNDVLKSFEDEDAKGSNYSYEISYAGTDGTARTLYKSERLGGDGSAGLLDAASNLDEYTALSELQKGQTGKVTVRVHLDGETEQNAYFDTLGRLKVGFAAEFHSPETPPSETPPPPTVVKTGDETNLFPFYLALTISGLALLALAIHSVRQGRNEQSEEGAR